jgi:hypothetical protein
MGKGLRIAVATLLLIGILALAQGQMARAGSLPGSFLSLVSWNPAASGVAAPQLDPVDPGTVKPPPAATTGGGVCIFRVIQPLASGFSMSQNLMPFTSLGTKPDAISTYLAGVCRAIYTEAGTGVIDNLGSNGQVEICFASVPDTNGVIYVYNPYQTETGPASGETYSALTTKPDGSLLCAPAQQTGKYFLANVKQ